MRLAVIASSFPYGTGEAFLAPELDAAAAAGAEPVIVPVSPRRRGAPRATPHAVLEAPRNVAFAALREIVRDPLRAARVAAEVLGDRGTAPRVTLKNAVVLPAAFALAGRIREAGIDHVHAYWCSTPATVGYVVARLTGIPFSATAHRWDIYEGNMLARKAALAVALRTISHRGARDLRARIAPADRSKVRTVRLGVKLDARTAAPAPPRSRFELLCAANLVAVKGHAHLIDAIAQARRAGTDVHLTLAGNGVLRGTLERQVAQLGLGDAVTFAGVVPHDALLDGLAAGRWDAAVLASTERPGGEMEGVPVALIEAMAAGVPCIGTTSGSIPELLAGCGVVVPAGDATALADAIAQLAADPAGRAALAAAGAARVRSIFNVHTRMRRLAAHLLGRKSQALTPSAPERTGTVVAPAFG